MIEVLLMQVRTSGVTVQSGAVNTQGRDSVSSKTVEVSPAGIAAHHSSDLVTDPGRQHGQAQDRSTDVHATHGAVKVQVPALQKTCPVSIQDHSKPDSSANLQGMDNAPTF